MKDSSCAHVCCEELNLIWFNILEEVDEDNVMVFHCGIHKMQVSVRFKMALG